MKLAIRLLSVGLFFAGCICFFKLSIQNKELSKELSRLEAELGRMSIQDPSRVHLVEIAKPDIPPEIASYLDGLWQFRCYLPAGFQYSMMSGGGRVTEDGLQSSSLTTSSSSPKPSAEHGLLTVSFQRKGGQLHAYYSFKGSGGSSSWNLSQPHPTSRFVVKKLVSHKQGFRSFDQNTILPLLKVYDPESADHRKPITFYEGGFILLCPKSRREVVDQLHNGKTPKDFDPAWLASGVVDE